MNRRDFLRRSAVVATGAVAADQLEILEKLGGWARKFFPGFGSGRDAFESWHRGPSLTVMQAEWDHLLREVYSQHRIEIIRSLEMPSPFKAKLRAAGNSRIYPA